MAIICVGGKTFSSKAELLKRLQHTLHAVPSGGDIPLEDLAILEGLLQEKPWFINPPDGKIVARVTTGLDAFKGKNFRVEWTDQTFSEFSYSKSISRHGKPYDSAYGLDSKIRAAFRNAVDPQTYAAKLAAIGQTCPACHQTLNDTNRLDTDHVGPHAFKDILVAFLHAENQAILGVAISGLPYRLLDDALKTRWETFHARLAVLEAKHRDCHRSKSGASIQPLDETWMHGSAKLRADTTKVALPKPFPDDEWISNFFKPVTDA